MGVRSLNQSGNIIRVKDETFEVTSNERKSPFFHLDRIKKQQKKMLPYFITGTVVLAMISVFYFNSSLSKLNMISFEGNTFLSKGTILELTGLKYEHFVLSIRPTALAKQIENHPLVSRASVKLNGLNDLKIEVEEEQVLGCVSHSNGVSLLLSTGALVDESLAGGQACHGIFFYEVDHLPDEMNLIYLTNALSELGEEFLALIDSIYYEPDFGDQYRFSLHLKDGNVVKVNTYTMVEKLKYYPTLVKNVKATYGEVHGTFHLDVGDRFEVHESLLESAIDFFENRKASMEE